MNENEKTILRNWISTQPDKDAGRLATKLNAKHVTAWNDYVTEEPRTDKILVQAEKMLKAIAEEYDISQATTPGQANQAFLTAYQAASTQAKKDKALDDKHMFWICFVSLRTVNVTGSDTDTISHHDPTAWSETIACSLGLPDSISWKDIEQL